MRPAQYFTGVILCGGRGRRLGGRDKGLVRLRGRPLIVHAAENLAPQVRALWVSINHNRGRYSALNLCAVQDRWLGYRGPLAGLASAIPCVTTPFVAIVPCDDPTLPVDFVRCLWRAMRARGADICVARCGDQLFPLHAVMKTRIYRSLWEYVSGGGAGVQQWLVRQSWTWVAFPRGSLNNINTAADLRECTSRGHMRR